MLRKKRQSFRHNTLVWERKMRHGAWLPKIEESHSTHSVLDRRVAVFRSCWHGYFNKFHRRIMWSTILLQTPHMSSHCFRMWAFLSMSSKKQISTRNSTFSELLGVSDCMPKVSYFRLFLYAQNAAIKKNVVLDNKSAMLMEGNRRSSCSKWSWHLIIRYFYFTDAMNNGEIEIACCPTEQMLVDFFIKPP